MPTVARPHLKFFRAIPGDSTPESPVVAATRDLLVRPFWHGRPGEFENLVTNWVTRVSREIETPRVHFSFSTSEYRHDTPTLMVAGHQRHRNAFKLFVAFAECLKAQGALPNTASSSDWAASLFYSARPAMFRKAARRGKIPGVRPEATFTNRSLAVLRENGISPSSPNATNRLRSIMAQPSSLTTGEDIVDAEIVTTTDTEDEDAPDVQDDEGVTNSQPHAVALNMNREELRRYVTAQGITGSSSMNKGQLLAALGIGDPNDAR